MEKNKCSRVLQFKVYSLGTMAPSYIEIESYSGNKLQNVAYEKYVLYTALQHYV